MLNDCLRLIPADNTLTLIDVLKFFGSTSEDDFHPNKFVRYEVLHCIESRFCIDVGGSYLVRGTVWA